MRVHVDNAAAGDGRDGGRPLLEFEPLYQPKGKANRSLL
jgi:hypothetical protein